MPWTIGDALLIVLVLLLIWSIMALVNRSRRSRPANAPAVPDVGPGDPLLRKILGESRTIAVVGASTDPARASHQVMKYLLHAGYEVYPVNPGAESILGCDSYPSLADLPKPPDIVDVFRDPKHVPAIATAAVAAGARTLWLQEGVFSPEGVQIARQAGLNAVMDHCIMKEHRRLLGRR